MSIEIIVALIGLVGVIIGAIPTYIFMRRKNIAEIDKILAEIEHLRAQTRAIEAKQAKGTKAFNPQYTYFEERPFQFIAGRDNHQPIASEFLLWEKCTILLWAKIPPKGQRLRSFDSNRYLISHMTDVANKEQGWPFYNRFSLGLLKDGTWSVTISSSKSQEKSVKQKDGLDPGWHQFYIAWDHTKPILVFAIDGGENGKKFSTDISTYWPDRIADNAWLGAWVTSWEGHYSETELFKVYICRGYFDIVSEAVKNYLSDKPG